RVPFRGQAGGIAYVGRRLLVSDYGGGRVLRLDPSSGRTLKRMRVGSEPRDLVLAAGALWVGRAGLERRAPDPSALAGRRLRQPAEAQERDPETDRRPDCEHADVAPDDPDAVDSRNV